ncbi:hypothetical protein C3744_26305 [Priestia megaterium]|uniref:Uncharacterized protein n=1 Tax=Priestia megaterium TaxID=1404 RepID=A0A3D8WV82_PRIMG|nr:hypothetical protein [Priestia megaterium]MDH3174756.1 hypothetical protein [Priestia megaterium]RDZ08115.1 hypothetical protein C3744_26305 [Priestia megaterium]
MIGLIIAIIAFNLIAFIVNKRLTANQILHIWIFTTAFQLTFDLYVNFKYHGYWYFTKGVDWKAFPAHAILIPPVNIIFLNWFPYRNLLSKKIIYLIYWDIALVLYEVLTLLPEPWGYFRYGWWDWWYSAAINPILLMILLGYYKWTCKLEEKIVRGQS